MRVPVAQHSRQGLQWSVFNFSNPTAFEEMKYTFLTWNLHVLTKSICCVLLAILCIFCEVPVRIFWQCLIGLCIVLLMSFKSLNKCILHYHGIRMCFANTFFQSVAVPFCSPNKVSISSSWIGAFGVSRGKKDTECLTNVVNLSSVDPKCVTNMHEKACWYHISSWFGN